MTYQTKRVTYGPLRCTVVDGGPSPVVAVVCLHGFGAPGDDLVPIAEQWMALLGSAAARVRFVFPAALLSLDAMGLPGGRAWWELNMARLMEAMELQDFRELHRHEPAGIDRAREAVTSACAAVCAEMGINSQHLVLGGFSQGAMLSMDVALRGLVVPPAVLFQYSGTVICESQWLAQMEKLIHTEVIQSHGAFDPILPYSSAEKLYEMLKVTGVPVQFHPFDGPHTLSYEAIAATAVAISRVVDAAIAEGK